MSTHNISLESSSVKRFWSASELLSVEFPEPLWAVPGILAPGLAILCGRPKVGKSWLALQLALAVSSNHPFLGEPVRQGLVLYYALEDSARRIQSRMEAQGWPDNPNVHFLCGSTSSLGEIIKDISKHGPRMAIVDTISRVLQGVDQNDVGQVTQAYSPLQRAALDSECCVILIDHLRKSSGLSADSTEDIMGSTAKAAVTDAQLLLYRERQSIDGILKVIGRDVEDQEIRLTLRDFQWERKVNAPKEPTTEQKVMAAFVSHPTGLTLSQLVGLTNLPQATAYRALSSLYRLGRLQRQALAIEGRGHRPAHVYFAQ